MRLEVSTQFQTPKALVQQYLFMPAKWKDCYLAYLLDDLRGQSTILFVATCQQAERTTLLLRNLGWGAVCLHGQMSQAKRLGALNKFKTGGRNLLIATDVAARGLDIPEVDLVVNFDLPVNAKDYVHRLAPLLPSLLVSALFNRGLVGQSGSNSACWTCRSCR